MTHTALALLLVLLLTGRASPAPPEPCRWQPHSAAVRPASAGALVARHGGGLAVGADADLWTGPARSLQRRALPVGSVRDVVEGADGVLWLATDAGLYTLDADGRLEDRSPAPGPRARDLRRVVPLAGGWVAASAAGVHLSPDGRRWQRIAALPAGAPSSLVSLPGRPTFAVAIRDGLFEVSLLRSNGELEVARIERLPNPDPSAEVRDLAAGPDGALLLLSDRALHVRGARGWQRSDPSLPPGAEAQRLRRVGARWYLIHSAGLSVADAPAGRWQRIAALGGRASFDVAGGAEGVWALTESGLVHGCAASPAVGGTARRLSTAPPIAAVQRAAIAHQGLGGGRLAGLRARVERRGWLPQLDIELFGSRGRARAKEYDEVFTSGALHQLRDRDLDRSLDYGVSLELGWDLGDAAYHPEEVDVARETREWIELRDAVLDELNQLYFERERALLRAEALAASDPAAAQLEWLRAGEFAAGIDAWTGGWFGRQPGIQVPPPLSPSGPDLETR